MANSDNKTAEKPNYLEIAVSGGNKDITSGFLANSVIQQNPDEILRDKGRGDFKIYEELMRDDQVKSVFQQRRLALVSKDWNVTPASESAIDVEAANFIREQVKKIKFDDKTDKMLYGVFYGYAVAECMWGQEGDKIVLDEIKVRKAKRFKFDHDCNLRLLTKDKSRDGIVMPTSKFWTFNTGADNDDNQYGEGLAKALYWPVFFKRNDIKFWLVFLEKFGMPTAKAEYQRGATLAEKEAILDALDAIQTDSSIAVPQGTLIELVEASRGGTADYAEMHNIMNAAISKIILSQTMTTDNGSSLAQAQVHNVVKNEVVTADSDLICDSFNDQVVKWLIEWNYPNAGMPKVSRETEEAVDTKMLAERDQIINDMGFRPTQEYIDDTYGEGFVKSNDITRQGGAQFSENATRFTPAQQAIEDLAEQSIMHSDSPIKKQAIESAIRGARSPEDLEARLALVLKDEDLSEFTQALEKSLFSADIMGYANG